MRHVSVSSSFKRRLMAFCIGVVPLLVLVLALSSTGSPAGQATAAQSTYKEFVSAKVAGEIASLANPALWTGFWISRAKQGLW